MEVVQTAEIIDTAVIIVLAHAAKRLWAEVALGDFQAQICFKIQGPRLEDTGPTSPSFNLAFVPEFHPYSSLKLANEAA